MWLAWTHIWTSLQFFFPLMRENLGSVIWLNCQIGHRTGGLFHSLPQKNKTKQKNKKKIKWNKNKATDFLTDLFNSQNSRIQLSIEMIYNWITKVSTTERIPWTLWGSCVLIVESCRPLSCLKKNLNPLNLTSSFDKTKAHILWLSMSYYGKLESRVQYTRIAVRGPSNHIINRSIHIQ